MPLFPKNTGCAMSSAVASKTSADQQLVAFGSLVGKGGEGN
jgi:hypothetical protein